MPNDFIVDGQHGRPRLTWQLWLTLFVFTLLAIPNGGRLRSALVLRDLLRDLEHRGEESSGLVIETHAVHHKYGDDLRVSYTYPASGSTYRASYLAGSLKLKSKFVAGARVPVTFDPLRPERSVPLTRGDLDAREVTAHVRADIPGMSFILVLLAGAAAAAVIQARAEWRIVSSGSLATGEVVAVSGQLLRRCRFRLSGSPTEHDVRVSSRSFRPKAGESIVVLVTTHPFRVKPVADLVYVKIGAG